jgi:hypothetical protein
MVAIVWRGHAMTAYDDKVKRWGIKGLTFLYVSRYSQGAI